MVLQIVETKQLLQSQTVTKKTETANAHGSDNTLELNCQHISPIKRVRTATDFICTERSYENHHISVMSYAWPA